jgi:hypothetical protein
VERWASNTLRILGIVATVVFVIAGCCRLLTIAWVVFIRGGLTSNARILHPQAETAFFGALIAVVALIVMGIVAIVKLIEGIAHGPNSSPPRTEGSQINRIL